MDQQPQVPQQPTPAQPPVSGQPVLQQPVYAENPGQTLGIIGLVLNILGIGIGGIILGAMSRMKSKQVGMSPLLGTISLVWGIVLTALVTLWVIFMVFIFIVAANSPTSTIDSTSTDSSSSFFSN